MASVPNQNCPNPIYVPYKNIYFEISYFNQGYQYEGKKHSQSIIHIFLPLKIISLSNS